MNILILNWRDIKNPSSGGAEVLTHELAKRWVAWGHEVIQFSSKFPGALEREVIDGVILIRSGHPDARRLLDSVHFKAFWYYIRQHNSFDIIVDEIHGIPFFTPWYVREKKVVLICEVAGELWEKIFGPFMGFIGEVTEKFYLRNIYGRTQCLTISNSTREDLVIHGIKKKNITVLPMGITVSKRKKNLKKEVNPTLIFVGRLTAPKGVKDAIHALKEIDGVLPNAQLWVVGRGMGQHVLELKKLVNKLNLRNKVKFFGFVSEEKKFELMGRAHLLLHPSLHEGFGLTIPEAGIVGTPAIGYNSAGIRDLIKNGKNGILVKHNSPKSLAWEAMILLKDQKRYTELSLGALREAQKYNWDETARTALSIMESL